jgi:hypothetical protein
MYKRNNKVPYLWYPEHPLLEKWNLFITLVLIFTSLVAPARVAFINQDSQTWVVINYIVDFSFLVDIFVIFNSALNDDDYNII